MTIAPWRHGVEAAGVERVAARDPPDGKPGAPNRAVARQCLQCIFRACRHKTAARPDQGRNNEAVKYNGSLQQTDEKPPSAVIQLIEAMSDCHDFRVPAAARACVSALPAQS